MSAIKPVNKITNMNDGPISKNKIQVVKEDYFSITRIIKDLIKSKFEVPQELHFIYSTVHGGVI